VKWLLENGPKVTALVSFAVLMLTVFHDWGYFWIIGSKFQSLQTTYDYIANSITWLPLSLAILAIYVISLGALFEFISRRTPNQRSAVQVAKARFRRPLFFLSGVAFAIFAVLCAIGANIIRFPLGPVCGTLGIFSLYTSVFSFTFYDLRRFGEYALITLGATTVPAVLLMSFLIGNFEAIFAISNGTNVYFLSDKDSNQRAVIALRTLDQGILTYNPTEHKIAFVRWDTLTKVEHGFFLPSPGWEGLCEASRLCSTAPEP
jgi:hypothetical protein